MPKTAAHLVATRFKPGHPGIGGRKPGSRTKITEAVLRAMFADFEAHGAATIEKVRRLQPASYLAAFVSLIPKQVEKIESPFSDLSDAELDQLELMLASIRAKTADIIEATAEPPRDLTPHPEPDYQPPADVESKLANIPIEDDDQPGYNAA